jgi:hypothetical protein
MVGFDITFGFLEIAAILFFVVLKPLLLGALIYWVVRLAMRHEKKVAH